MAVKKKSGLGKGLDALISPSAAKTSDKKEKTAEKPKEVIVEQVIEKVVEKPGEIKVKIDEIEPNRQQPRQHFDEDSLLELADSIKQFGVIQPLILQKNGDFYSIIAGERRWRAARLAG